MLSRTDCRAVRPATVISAAATNHTPPKIATGIPWNVLKRLWYTWVQLIVALTSQKLRYIGSYSM
jgi:hypothetical protein